MNSFNHYAYGAIGAWLYAVVAGIDVDPEKPGYKHIIMRPRPGGGLTGAKAEFLSQYGLIRSAWKWENGVFEWRISVPANTTATVHIPFSGGASIWEGDQLAEKADCVSLLFREDDTAVYQVGSGDYHFTVHR
jgi:alpha-L-rhamnosidase